MIVVCLASKELFEIIEQIGNGSEVLEEKTHDAVSLISTEFKEHLDWIAVISLVVDDVTVAII